MTSSATAPERRSQKADISINTNRVQRVSSGSMFEAAESTSPAPQRNRRSSFRRGTHGKKIAILSNPALTITTPNNFDVDLCELGKKHLNARLTSTSDQVYQLLREEKSNRPHHFAAADSISSKPSTDFSHGNLWVNSDAWAKEVCDIDRNINELEASFQLGRLQAFGKSTTAIFKHLDSMRRQQFQIFQRHVDVDKQVRQIVENDNPGIDVMESEGLNTDGAPEISTAVEGIFHSLSVLCKDIQSLSANGEKQ